MSTIDNLKRATRSHLFRLEKLRRMRSEIETARLQKMVDWFASEMDRRFAEAPCVDAGEEGFCYTGNQECFKNPDAYACTNCWKARAEKEAARRAVAQENE